jgi:hypothetical protein
MPERGDTAGWSDGGLGRRHLAEKTSSFDARIRGKPSERRCESWRLDRGIAFVE